MLENGERKLVTIRKISEVLPHANADALELAIVDGWQCVVKKGEFQPEDGCVYIEIDAILPDGNPAWQFLVDKQGKHYEKGLGARLKTIKLRGEYSQGLALPLGAFDFRNDSGRIAAGVSLDEILGVYKYEPPVSGLGGGAALAGNARGDWPSWFPKTNQERIENCFKLMKPHFSLRDFYIEEKLEGSSITIYSDNGDYGVCSRNVNMKIDESNAENAFVKTAKEMRFDNLTEIPGRWAVRGEMVGPGVQGNIYNLENLTIYIFDVWDGNKGRYLTPVERVFFCEDLRNLGVVVNEVPTLDCFSLTQDTTVGDIVKLADGQSALNPKTRREGLVFKSADLVESRHGSQVISFKAISREYLAAEK